MWAWQPPPPDQPGEYNACVSLDINGGTVGVIRSIQFIDGAAIDSIDHDLRTKFGRPTFFVHAGGQETLKWVGTTTDGKPIEVDAQIQSTSVTTTELTITLHPWTNPHKPAATQVTGETSPKL